MPISSSEPNLTVPSTYQWNLNTQYEFLPSWLLELAYVGSHGIHQGAESPSAQQGQITTFIGNNIAPLVGPMIWISAGCWIEAHRAAEVYHRLLDAIAARKLDANISIKLTQMGLELSPNLAERIATDLAEHARTNAYEVMTALGRRYARLYQDGATA